MSAEHAADATSAADPAIFDEMTKAMTAGGADAALERLAAHLKSAHQYHDLFDVRLMQARLKHGLPVIWSKTMDELPEPGRTAVEDASIEACREVGKGLLAVGRVREAWMYLRPTGEKAEVAAALESLVREDESLAEEVIDIALNEGVAPRLGFQLMLNSYGLCNAVTTYDSTMQGRPKGDRISVAGLLVEHIHDELLHNVKEDIKRQQGTAPTETTLADLVRDRQWLFENDNYHTDSTHLASIVRFAVVLDDPQLLRRAIDLTEYGKHLGASYQFPGDPPFTDAYPHHALFFHALLGEQVDEATKFFKAEAEQALEDQESAPIEVYLSLLARTGRLSEALDETARLQPPGKRQGDLAPTLQELAQSSGDYTRLMNISRARGDLLGFAAGLTNTKPAK
ncbi:MAG: hypothetical protein K8U03_22065 [Planctomycetia bacterium]|nr:hypothetical protein [Planctomycetia bacterium]